MPLRKAFRTACLIAIAALTALANAPSPAAAEALLLIEVDSGRVLQAENATLPWYPASLTKLMTAYVTLKAIKEGRITPDTPFVVSANALAQPPTKMGFKIGTVVTVDNALKMLLVKSANDMAVVLAEGVGGSIDGFSDMMNAAARRLGMTQTSYVNPNGLPADGQISSARDLAILARAIYRELPEYAYMWHLPGIKFGRRVVRNYNKLLELYPGADGMKTGFICASGFNLVATATRNKRRLVAVVLGAPSASVRMYKAAKLLEQGFNNNRLSWLMPTLGTVDQLQPIDAAPVNLREETCGAHRRRPAAEDEEVEVSGVNGTGDASPLSFLNSPSTVKLSHVLGQGAASLPPVEVFVGTVKPATVAAAEAQESQLVGGGGKRGKKAKAKSKTKTAEAAAKSTSDAADAKPAKAAKKASTAKPTAAKPKPAARATSSVQTAATPAAAAPQR